MSRGRTAPAPTGSRPHHAALEGLGLSPPALRRLAAYLDLLAAWNRRVNLTGATTPAERVDVLVRPVLPLADLLEGDVLDVGSGNGSPGVVLAVLRPQASVTLLEPRQRRWAFLCEAARVVGRPRLQVLRLRYQQYAGPPVRTLLARGLAAEAEALAGLIASGGQLLTSAPVPSDSPRLVWVEAVGTGPRRFQRYRRRPDVPRET